MNKMDYFLIVAGVFWFAGAIGLHLAVWIDKRKIAKVKGEG